MAENIEIAVTPGERGEIAGLRGVSLPVAKLWDWAGLAAVVGLSLGLNTWHLARNGYGNTYYAAAVRSMTGSWNNFFFGAFDPGGFITVDKPPVFLWAGALSARIFGYSAWSILLPSALAGVATVALLWLIVRRYFGPLAATVAGAALAVSPITVAVDRLNLPEPILILTLLGAVAAILWSLESRRWWAWTLLGGALVGVAFNTKMLAAWIPGPALVLGVIAAYPRLDRLATLRRVALQLAVLGAATFAVSASWMVVVDHWPGDRPYIGGSKDNTVQNLIVDYNGVGRVEGNAGPGGGGPRPAQGNQPVINRGVAPGLPPNGAQSNGGQPNGAAAVPGNAINGPGGIIAGSPGLWRMFDDANGPQIAWLMPLALLGAVPALYAWRRDRAARAAIVVFLGWILTFGLVFSYAKGIYHSYYTAALAPGVAALAGITVASAVQLAKRDWRWLLAFVPIVAVTMWLQLDIAGRFTTHQESARPLALAVVVLGSFAAGTLAIWKARVGVAAGVAVIAAGMLAIPAAWSFYEAAHPSINTTLPQAGPRQGAAGRSFGSQAFDGGVASLAAWLEAHRDSSARWDLAVTSAQNASTLIAQYELSVMAIGGFSGSDPTITVTDFAKMVADGDVRYVLTTQGGPGGQPANAGDGRVVPGAPVQNAPGGTAGRPGVVPNGQRAGGVVPNSQQDGAAGVVPGGIASSRGANVVMSAVRSACSPVTGTDVPANYQGSLYDCAGMADRLRGTAKTG